MVDIMEFQTQVSLGIVAGPIAPAIAIHQGKSSDEIVASSIAAGLETYLFLQYLGGGTRAIDVAKFRKYGAWRIASASAPVVAAATIAGVGSKKYIGAMEKMAPSDPAQKGAFMNSVAASMAGTFGGMTLE
jgi:hypothetical protein